MVGENLSFTHPLWKDSLNALSFTGGVRNKLFETDAILPDTSQSLPSELWGVNLGLRYNRQLEDGWISGRRREHRIGERPPLRHSIRR